MANSSALDDVANAFHIWRTTKRGGQAIPSELWDKVAAVANRHTMSKICQQLGVRGAMEQPTDLRTKRWVTKWLQLTSDNSIMDIE